MKDKILTPLHFYEDKDKFLNERQQLLDTIAARDREIRQLRQELHDLKQTHYTPMAIKHLSLLLIPFLFIGCAADGSFDSAGFSSAVKASTDVYNQYRTVGYDQYGNPIYR